MAVPFSKKSKSFKKKGYKQKSCLKKYHFNWIKRWTLLEQTLMK